ncbi:Meiosis-expressed [Phytophthora cactorum]|nr:Meiosis-expressed [Phytophthora cactorum]
MDALLPPTPQKGAMMQRYERIHVPERNRGSCLAQTSANGFVLHGRGGARAEGGQAKKKKQKTLEHTGAEDQEQTRLRALSEPPPNTDTEFLRAHSHEAFVAGPPTIFSSRERKVVKDFAEDFYMTHAPNEEIPLQVWNGIHKWQGMRKSRQLPIERSQEDAALRRLATGEADSTLVNQWPEIAKRMPIPGRPAAHCLTRYQTALCANSAKSGFTPEEDQILREAVPIFGEKWNVIADLLDGRVSEQIRHRWQLTLAPGLRRGKFSVIEDRRMLLALRAYVSNGSEYNLEQVAWNDISHHIPGRTQPAIRDRFLNCLNPELSFRKFTKQEDQIILARVREWGIESARLWPRLAAELGDRTDSQVCRRWRFLDPEAYEKRSQALEEATARQTTAVFRRRSIHRHAPSGDQEAARSDTLQPDVTLQQQFAATSFGTVKFFAGSNAHYSTLKIYLLCLTSGKTSTYLFLPEKNKLPLPCYLKPKSTCKSMEVLSVNATSVARSSLSSRKGSTSRSSNTQYKMDEEYSSGNNNHAQPQLNPVVTSTKATRCYRPRSGVSRPRKRSVCSKRAWRDIKEYMETYGEPERWQNGFVRCTRVKANGYYTYWRPHRECDDKYLHTVKLFEYA